MDRTGPQTEKLSLRAAPGGEDSWPEDDRDTTDPELAPSSEVCEDPMCLSPTNPGHHSRAPSLPRRTQGGHRHGSGRMVRGCPGDSRASTSTRQK